MISLSPAFRIPHSFGAFGLGHFCLLSRVIDDGPRDRVAGRQWGYVVSGVGSVGVTEYLC